MASGDVSGSFRDTSGFIFTRDGVIYRQVNQVYRGHYDLLMTSGLYAELTNAGLLVPHEEGDVSLGKSAEAYKVLRPEPVKFTSYPYEWCFSQLKDAALTTLEIQKRALKSGMTLKDASAYNIQFVKGKPVLIDTLSFEKYVEGKPWVAYRQFCQHFLAPLALMSYKDVRLNQLFRVYIDGVPLDMASSLLPMRSRLNLPVLLNIHMHAASQKRYADKPVSKGTLGKRMSRTSFLGLVDSLESCIRGLVWRPRGTEWAEYYQDDSYTPEALEHKKRIVGDFLDKAKPNAVWDLGGNIGVFSRLASGRGIDTVSFDIDPACVEINYRTVKDKGGDKHPAPPPRPHQSESGHRLGERRENLAIGAGWGEDGDGAGAGPPSGYFQQRASGQNRRLLAPDVPVADNRVCAQERPQSAKAPGDAEGHFPRLHPRGF